MPQIFRSLAIAGFIFAVSCGRFTPSALYLAQNTDQTIGCAQDFEDEFWNGLYGFSLNQERFVESKEMARIFQHVFKKGRLKHLDKQDRERLTQLLTDLYELLSSQSLRELGVDPNNLEQVLETLTNLEMGARDTKNKALLQDRIRAKFNEIEKFVSNAQISQSCRPPQDQPPSDSTPLLDKWQQTRHPIVYGALKSFATSYQSCDVGFTSALTTSTSAVKGISITGTHSDGVGRKRVISDLTALIGTHPYLNTYVKPAANCQDVLMDPMIYDYGGKPYADNTTDSELNFFRDAGTGTSALGIDCSGYVYSALATAGLKLKQSGRLKAINVMGVPARAYMNPQANGLTCFEYATFNREQNLLPGDILASSGHIIIIEEVGTDPFGIVSISNESSCTTNNIDVAKFDFTILHSSPVKGGIGINRMRASDYLVEVGGSMKTALIQHAVNACLAKTRNSKVVSQSSYASLVRHLGTPDCLDRPIRLTHEDCLSRCPASSVVIGTRD